MTAPASFDIDASRRYWRLAPSGAGKHDTSALSAAEETKLIAEWRDGFARRMAAYAEEEMFLEAMGREFSGKSVLSIGSGLGFHEMYYASCGAKVVCTDIVPTNLAVVRRMAAHFGLSVETFVLEPDSSLGGPYDAVFIYGSLMCQPEANQRRLLERSASVLAPAGSIVLMLYTWEFARATCGWTSKEQFDPARFARASDESVGDEHCPWSDWHDDEKLVSLAPPGFFVSRSQLWQQDWFSWQELKRGAAQEPPSSFFDVSQLVGQAVADAALDGFAAGEAKLQIGGNAMRVRTGRTTASYAAVSAPIATNGANLLVIDMDLVSGAFSAGVLDEARNAFVVSAPIRARGRRTHVFATPPLPEHARIVLSNFRDSPAESEGTVCSVKLARRTRAGEAFLKMSPRR